MGAPNIIRKTNTSSCIGLLSYLNKFFHVLLTVHLTIILVINQLDA